MIISFRKCKYMSAYFMYNTYAYTCLWLSRLSVVLHRLYFNRTHINLNDEKLCKKLKRRKKNEIKKKEEMKDKEK